MDTQELAWHDKQVEELGRMVDVVCAERMTALEDELRIRAATSAPALTGLRTILTADSIG